MQRITQILGNHSLQRVLRILEAHTARNQPEVLEQPHAMRVYRKNWSVERVEHRTPSGLQSDPRIKRPRFSWTPI